MDVNIRELKANLRSLIRRAEAGDTVTVNVRNRPVARIVPIAKSRTLKDLAHLPSVSWKGGKPAGLPHGERLPRGINLSDWVAKNRR